MTKDEIIEQIICAYKLNNTGFIINGVIHSENIGDIFIGNFEDSSVTAFTVEVCRRGKDDFPKVEIVNGLREDFTREALQLFFSQFVESK